MVTVYYSCLLIAVIVLNSSYAVYSDLPPSGIPPPVVVHDEAPVHAALGPVPGGFGPAFPGAGLGFRKSLDISGGGGLGISPFLSGLGLGGIPPIAGVPDPALGGDIPPPGVPVGGFPGAFPPGGPVGGFPGAFPPGVPFGGFPGAFPPFGLIGPSYIPSTWLGSALGAKGDLFFPIVIFVFFVAGVWTVIQFLLGIIVPLIAGKLAIADGVAGVAGIVDQKLRARDLVNQSQEDKDAALTHLTTVVLAALSEASCMKMIACKMGHMVHSKAGDDDFNDLQPHLDSLKSSDSETFKVFHSAATKGKDDCSKYFCSPKVMNAESELDNHIKQ